MTFIPSVCHIRVEIRGRRIDLEQFRKSISGFEPVLKGNVIISDFSEFCLNRVAPISDEFIAMQSLTMLSKLRLGIWGCDSRAINVKLKQEDHKLVYTFAVFETPPFPVLNKLIKTHHLKFRIEYTNPQTGLSGLLLGRAGRAYHRHTDRFENERVG